MTEHTEHTQDMMNVTMPRTRPRRTGNRLLAGGAAVIGAGALVALPLRALAQEDGGDSDVSEGSAVTPDLGERTGDDVSERSGHGTAVTPDLSERTGDDWIDDALSGLVEDGALTQAQVDAVEEALREARPERGPGGGFRGGFVFGFGVHAGLAEAAEVIGIEESALMEALRDGQTLAEVAEANGVDPQAVINALIADAETHLDEAVADGRIDEAEAAERREQLSERITQFVNEGFPVPRGDRAEGDGPPTTEDEETTVTTPEAPTTTAEEGS